MKVYSKLPKVEKSRFFKWESSDLLSDLKLFGRVFFKMDHEGRFFYTVFSSKSADFVYQPSFCIKG